MPSFEVWTAEQLKQCANGTVWKVPPIKLAIVEAASESDVMDALDASAPWMVRERWLNKEKRTYLGRPIEIREEGP